MRHPHRVGPVMLLVAGLAAVVRADPPTTAPATTRPAANANAQPRDLGSAQASARQLGIGLIMYANDHRGRYPATLGELLKYTGPANAAAYLTPGNARRLAPLPAVPTAGWVTANASFEYLGAGAVITHIRKPSTTVVLHTPVDDPINPTGKGPVVLVGYADGHVETVSADKAKAAVAESAKALAAAR